jgi:NAD(P)-dependent dehydrogenase (short-subunit alcohol dehydrogenase family)
MINAVLPQRRKARRGRIINVGSLAAWVGEPGEAYYSASKRALGGLTESVHHEVWPLGIRVSLIEPGAFQTNKYKGRTEHRRYDASRRSAWRALEKSLRNGGDPRKVADLILNVAIARTPRLRYGAGNEARWLPLMKVLLPQRLFDHLLRRAYGRRNPANFGLSPDDQHPP